jgi:Sulfotransferase family
MSEHPVQRCSPRVFVLCPAFHGATLFGLLLNNHSEISALGDTFPRRSYDQLCSCGQMVSRCAFWIEVGRRVAADRFLSCPYLVPILPRLVNGRDLNSACNLSLAGAAWIAGPTLWKIAPDSSREFIEVVDAFERAVLEAHGTSIFVDGHKNLARAMVLATMTPRQRPLKLLHLVRDPRGYRNSSHRYQGRTAAADARKWKRQHGLILHVARLLGWAGYMRVRYEDLCADPDGVMAQVFRFLGIGPQAVVGLPRAEKKYHLMGNRMLHSFDGAVRLDASWREHLTASEQETTVRVAGPLARRFGYRI